MAKSSVSADIQAANSKMAKYLRRREEEEEGLQIGKRKIKDVAKEQRTRQGAKGRHAKWSAKPDFSYPTPMVDRPQTDGGATSFHFSFTKVTKQGSPTVNGKPLAGVGGNGKNPAVDHSKYIERDGAAEHVEGTAHAAYIERDGAVEIAILGAEIQEGIERELSSLVSEKPLEDEASLLGLQDMHTGVPSIFSNISDDQFLREEFWRAVHRTEREAKVHSIIIDPTINDEFWKNLPASEKLHSGFKGHCITELERYRQWQATDGKKADAKPFIPAPWKASAEACGKALVSARLVPGYDFYNNPIEFKSGPGGKLQMRMVAELPHEISAADRAQLVQNFCDHLGSIAKDADGETLGMMYTAVIHAPDAHNDRRNYHLHVIAHDRPAQWLPSLNQWDFEVEEFYPDPGSSKVLRRFPFRQNKIGEVERKLSTKKDENGKSKAHAFYQNEIAGADFIPHLRRKFAQITNQILAERGIERRYDHRTYEKMGIDRTPTEHLGTRAAALEAIGVPTVVGRLNAWAIWGDAERDIARRARKVDSALRIRQGELEKLIHDAHRTTPEAMALHSLRELVVERSNLISLVADDRREIMTFDLIEAKAKSRAIRTRQTCLQFLAEIEAGKANAQTRTAAKHIQARWTEAQAWIDKIDNDLAPERSTLAAAALDVRKREDRIQEIDALLVPITQALGHAVDQYDMEQAEKRKRSKKPKKEAAPAQTEADVHGPTMTVQVGYDLGPALKPVSLDGLPIVEPTIDPQASPVQPASPAPVEGLTPIDLAPLRPQVETSSTIDPTDTNVVEFSDTAGPSPTAPGRESATSSDAPKPSIGDDNIHSASKPTMGNGNTPEQQSDLVITPPTVEATDSLAAASERVEQPSGAQPNEAFLNTPTDAPAASEVSKTDTSPSVSAAETVSTQPTGQVPTKSQPPVLPAHQDKLMDDATKDDPQSKPGTNKAAPAKAPRVSYEDWDGLINLIANERMPIVRTRSAEGAVLFTVPTITPEQKVMLENIQYQTRTTGRLATIFDRQQQEIGRLVRWIEKAGQDPAALVIQGRNAHIGKAPQSVRTLFSHWGQQERVKDALRAEHGRRIEEAEKAKARSIELDRQPTQTPSEEEKAKQARIEEAAKIYPLPEHVRTPLVRDFVTLLRAGASPEALQAAAEAIQQSRIAVEDVNRSRAELAIAWRTALDDDLARAARARAKDRSR